jgi:hypothetical protein
MAKGTTYSVFCGLHDQYLLTQPLLISREAYSAVHHLARRCQVSYIILTNHLPVMTTIMQQPPQNTYMSFVS